MSSLKTGLGGKVVLVTGKLTNFLIFIVIKTVWFPGASSGIGQQAAIEFAQNKCKLAIVGRNKDALNETAQACISHGVPESEVGWFHF